jgi:hypothetical protein
MAQALLLPGVFRLYVLSTLENSDRTMISNYDTCLYAMYICIIETIVQLRFSHCDFLNNCRLLAGMGRLGSEQNSHQFSIQSTDCDTVRASHGIRCEIVGLD